MGIFSSRGRRHLDGHKDLTHHDEFIDLSSSVKSVYLPVVSPNLKDIEIVVNEGDEVKVGTRIGTRTDFYVPVYSPVSGVVKGRVMKFNAAVGRPVNHLVIENDFKYTKEENALTKVTLESSPEEIFAAIKEAGLVGLGGAGFPTYVKYNNPTNIHTLLVNGVECEPFLTTDYVAMSNDVESLLVGCELLMKASGATKAVIAIKVHKAAVKNAIKAKLAEHPSIKLVEVPDKYPMGWERTLIKQVFKKTYDRLPSELGIIVNNGQTVIELAKVLLTGHPMTDRLVTVSGDAVANPTNVYVKIGTQAKELIEACGGLTSEDANLIPGGPMCTKAVNNDVFPVVMQLGALTILQVRTFNEEPCLRCGSCIRHCPANLQPIEIRNALKAKDYDRLLKLDALSCVECGMCSYSCPSRIELTDAVKNAKPVVKFKMAQVKK